jgi:hypothetical protein
MDTYFELMDKQYPTIKELRKIQTMIKRNPTLRTCDDEWVLKNFQPIIDFVGDVHVLSSVVSESTKIIIKPTTRTELKEYKNKQTTTPLLLFTGTEDGGHWTSIKTYEHDLFDPYHEYQLNGTNQFCQTFSLMNITLDQMPIKMKGFPKYYTYATEALKFIRDVVVPKFFGTQKSRGIYKKKSITDNINECFMHPFIIINGIEVLPNDLT